MQIICVVVEDRVCGVEIREYICWQIVVEEIVYVCVRDVCVGSRVCCCHEKWTVLSVQLNSQEVPESPVRYKFMPECVFDEDGNAVELCFCSVACSVTVVSYMRCCDSCAV